MIFLLTFYFLILQSLLKTADQLKIKGLCEVPESREGPPSVSLSSPPPRDTGTTRLNFTKLKRHHPRYKRPRTTFEPRATSTDSRHYDKYKEEEHDIEGLGRDNNKEVCHKIIHSFIHSSIHSFTYGITEDGTRGRIFLSFLSRIQSSWVLCKLPS